MKAQEGAHGTRPHCEFITSLEGVIIDTIDNLLVPGICTVWAIVPPIVFLGKM
jgi:hypothetical protein